MTDNRTTELLRKLLEERGIEYETNDYMGTYGTNWNGFMATQYSPNANLIMAVTPEQAIAATLGSERETCHAESDLSEWVCSNCQCWIPLGLTPDNIKHASEWRYCPHCGAEVVSE